MIIGYDSNGIGIDDGSAPVPNDAAGGSGSIAGSLLAIAVGGLSRSIDGALAKKYPTGPQLVDANGRPVGAPQATSAQAKGAALAFFSNPVTLGVGAAVALSVIVILLVRR
jgi:hypothetical protein